MKRQVQALVFISLWLIGQACGWSPSVTQQSPASPACCRERAVRPACSAVCCRTPAEPGDSTLPDTSTTQKAIDEATPAPLQPVLLWLLPAAHPISGMAGLSPTRCLPPPDSIYLRLESLLI